jgi:hypothetical protein
MRIERRDTVNTRSRSLGESRNHADRHLCPDLRGGACGRNASEHDEGRVKIDFVALRVGGMSYAAIAGLEVKRKNFDLDDVTT